MICVSCGTDKPDSEFYLRKSKDGERSWPRSECKRCNCDKRRTTHLRIKYGLSREQFTEMLVAQNYQCLICDIPLLTRVDVDHDHLTGQVRGLLCVSCNGGLGIFKDSIERLERAIQYLKGGKKK